MHLTSVIAEKDFDQNLVTLDTPFNLNYIFQYSGIWNRPRGLYFPFQEGIHFY